MATLPPGPSIHALRIKLFQVIDQSMEAEILMLPERKLKELRAAHIVKFGDAPTENSEVTDAQLTALHYVIDSGLQPCVDFSVWGPFGARQDGPVKFKARLLDCHGQ